MMYFSPQGLVAIFLISLFSNIDYTIDSIFVPIKNDEKKEKEKKKKGNIGTSPYASVYIKLLTFSSLN